MDCDSHKETNQCTVHSIHGPMSISKSSNESKHLLHFSALLSTAFGHVFQSVSLTHRLPMFIFWHMVSFSASSPFQGPSFQTLFQGSLLDSSPAQVQARNLRSQNTHCHIDIWATKVFDSILNAKKVEQFCQS